MPSFELPVRGARNEPPPKPSLLARARASLSRSKQQPERPRPRRSILIGGRAPAHPFPSRVDARRGTGPHPGQPPIRVRLNLRNIMMCLITVALARPTALRICRARRSRPPACTPARHNRGQPQLLYYGCFYDHYDACYACYCYS